MRFYFLVTLLLCTQVISPAHAEPEGTVYRYVDESGREQFTDNLNTLPEARRAAATPIGGVINRENNKTLNTNPSTQTPWELLILGAIVLGAMGVVLALKIRTLSRQRISLVGAFGMFAKLAKADGQVSPIEIGVLENYMQHTLKLKPQKRKKLIRAFKKAKYSSTSFSEYTAQVYQTFRQHPEILSSVMKVLADLARADGAVHPREELLLKEALRTFGFRPERFFIYGTSRQASSNTEWTTQIPPKVPPHYELLESTLADSMSVIRKRYRKLVKTHHPDRLVGRGLSKELIEVARQQFIAIQQAYEKVTEERGT